MKNQEVWEDIPEYEGLYQASNLGRIRSLPRNTTKGRILKPYIHPTNGYSYSSVCKNNNAKTKRTHVLILKAFRPTEDEAMQVNHIDGDKTNNKLENLEWVTQSENMKHAFDTGLEVVTWNKPVIRLDDLKVYESVTECSLDNGGKKTVCVSRVCAGSRSNYKGKRFAFYDDYINGTIPECKVKRKRNGVV